MKRIGILKRILSIVAMLLLVPAWANEERNPSIVFILTDDLGYSDVGCYGATGVKTPNIDRLAAEGMLFPDFHTSASICSPSRAAFLTGGYPQRSGLYMGINPIREAHWFLGLNPAEITIAEQLKQAGYRTFMVGKWHLGTEPEFLPEKQGFDSYYGMPCNFAHSPRFFDDGKEVFAKTPLERLTELYTKRVIRIITENRTEPFFLYYAHNYPHLPYRAGPKFRGSSKDGVRGDVIQELDWSVGEVMKTLKATGQDENTIVIFTSDNGPTKNRYAKPFRGTKYVTLEGGHRVPFVFHWPARIRHPGVCAQSVNAMDLFPTLSDVADVPLPEDRVYDGTSLVPLLEGNQLPRKTDEPFFYYNCENLQAVRLGKWKLHLPRSQKQLPFWDKNKVFRNLPRAVLYNLASDRGETIDVAAKHPEMVTRMLELAGDARAKLGEYMHRGSEQRPTGSVIPNAPVISHPKDWHIVDSAIDNAITTERRKRHPGYADRKKKRKR